MTTSPTRRVGVAAADSPGRALVERAVVVPQRLRPGDGIRVIAPSSPFDARLLWRALGWLAQRYEVRYSRRIFARRGYFAGDDEHRRDELRHALDEPGVKVVLAARGGYGVSRFAHQLDWTVLRRRPRWLVGFSDVTALHVEAARQGVASMHACNATALGRGDARARAAWAEALERPHQRRCWRELTVLRPGRARGRVFGGNLTLLHACAAAGRLAPPANAIWVIEDVAERPYRLDRMLTTLMAGGYLEGAAAVVVGELDECEAGPDGWTTREMLADRIDALGVPAVVDAPVGHGLRNEPFVLGSSALLDATGPAATLTFEP